MTSSITLPNGPQQQHHVGQGQQPIQRQSSLLRPPEPAVRVASNGGLSGSLRGSQQHMYLRAVSSSTPVLGKHALGLHQQGSLKDSVILEHHEHTQQQAHVTVSGRLAGGQDAAGAAQSWLRSDGGQRSLPGGKQTQGL